MNVKILVLPCDRPEGVIVHDILQALPAKYWESFNFERVNAIQATYEEQLWEIRNILKIESSCNGGGDKDKAIVKHKIKSALEYAVKWCKSSQCQLEQQPWLSFDQNDFYYMRCQPIHSIVIGDEFFKGFAFGNLVNRGLFLQRCGRISPDMAIDFEHDQKEVTIYIGYPIHDNLGRLKPRAYRVRMKYTSIHQMVFDLGSSTNKTMSMYFRIRCPPAVDEVSADRHLETLAPYSYTSFLAETPAATVFEGKFRDLHLMPRSRSTIRTDSPCFMSASEWGRSPYIRLDFEPGTTERDQALRLERFYEIVGRLRTKAKCEPYFSYVHCKDLSQNFPETGEIMLKNIPLNFFSTSDLETSKMHDYPAWIEGEKKRFACHYALEALLGRGYVVLDQMTGFDDLFYKLVRLRAESDPDVTEEAIFRLVNAIDECKFINLLNAFNIVHKQVYDEKSEDNQVEAPRNCVKVRKLIITPTRMIYLEPETQMSNRVTRQFGNFYAMRVVFRDDDMSRLFQKKVQPELLESLFAFLRNPIDVGGWQFNFLAWSNSQLRDHGCYTYADVPLDDGRIETAETIRAWMGNFGHINNVPKLMARMGQCFTQSQPTIELGGEEYTEEPDVTGGMTEEGQEDYIFSDGVGRISYAFAVKLCQQAEITDHVPSAYQIRCAGFKGMLSVDPRMDETVEQVVFRKSMNKFSVGDKQEIKLELVKHAQPSPVYLNRPFLSILDQVSKKQSRKRNQSICKSVHRFLEKSLFSMAEMLMSENRSAQVLKDATPLAIDYKALRLVGFHFTTEPFFRNMLLAMHKHKLSYLVKAKIEIPMDLGRTMYGIMDEFNVLNYGQVFVQYSPDKQKPHQDSIIIKGTVMVTKNPCIVPGDVRLFDAVDQPCFHHLVDVIVFPSQGPRPHPDEMAGSDLDGDEYAVIWDKDLFLHENADPYSFPKYQPVQLDHDVTVDDMINFFSTYVQEDKIGRISTAHLAKSDNRHQGIWDDDCMKLAAWHSMAVDFPKTGIPPPVESDAMHLKKWPDFMMKFYFPMYRSCRLLGQTYRKVSTVEEVIAVGKCTVPIVVDEDLNFAGWEKYKLEARAARDHYNQHIQSLLDQYGIEDEFQLVSGHLVHIRNRLSDGEKEDFSQFNTEKIIELRISHIWSKFRRDFFREFYGEVDEATLKQNIDDCLPDDVLRKASAYYMVTYDFRTYGNTGRLISFPWMLWDVLLKIKRNCLLQDDKKVERTLDPIYDELNGKLDRLYQIALNNNDLVFALLEKAIDDAHSKAPFLIKYIEIYSQNDDMKKLFWLLVRWAHQEKGDDEYTESSAFFRIETPDNLIHSAIDSSEGKLAVMCKSKLVLHFIKFLSSETFRNADQIDFQNKDGSECLSSHVSMQNRSQWLYVHSIAFKTFHHIALTNRFDAIYLKEDTENADDTWDVDESEILQLSFPKSVVPNQCLTGRGTKQQTEFQFKERLKEWSGVDDLELRMNNRNRNNELYSYNVIARGKLEYRQKIKCLLQRESIGAELFNNKEPKMVYEF